jgi:hypothetical protein
LVCRDRRRAGDRSSTRSAACLTSRCARYGHSPCSAVCLSPPCAFPPPPSPAQTICAM